MQQYLNLIFDKCCNKEVITIDDDTLKIWSYVNISTYRVKTVKALKDDVKTPTQIANDAGIRTNHISKVLKQLKETGVAECLNEGCRKGRIYRLTSLGDEIVDKLDK